MALVALKGSTYHTIGDLPRLNQRAPDFQVTLKDLSDIKLKAYAGKKIILNIFPSIDTATCAMSVRQFNQRANGLKNTVVLCISADLPFAQARFCAAEGLENVVTASIFRHRDFGEHYGVRIMDGPLAGLLARAVVVMNHDHEIIYTQLVPEITNEPDYEAALESLTTHKADE